jgi:hypothetical protein
MVNNELKKIFSFSAGASIFWLISHIMHFMYLVAKEGIVGARVSIMENFFYLLLFFFGSLINLVPPLFIRYYVPGRPLYGQAAAVASLVNYATVMMILSLPWQLVLGDVGNGVFYFLMSSAAKIICALILLVGGFAILVTPEKNADMNPPLDNTSKCMLRLANFISYAKNNIDAETSLDKLWQPVYSYLKSEKVISDAISKGIPVDVIVMNAVGAVAYRLIESGRFHKSRGVLSREGEQIVLIWKMAANELINRSYNSPADMERGLEALKDAIVRSGG